MKQFIFGGYSSLAVGGQNKTLLKSSMGSVVDFARDSDISRVGGVLCSFKSVPIAFWGVSTLNDMVFSRKLWEMLLGNPYLKRSLEDGSHYGEAFHANRDEVLYPEVACRVTNFWLGENNLVLGDVDILNTPNGVIVYTLAKISRVGISSRGFGELKEIDNGLKDVVPEDYLHICWDMVAFPAVPDASMTLITGEGELPSKELRSMSDQLRGLVQDACEQYPEDRGLRNLWNSMGKKDKGRSSLRNDVISALIAHRLHSGITPLFSDKKHRIMSMANVGFTRPDIIQNLREVVLDIVYRFFGDTASWDFSERPVDTGRPGSTGKFLKWRSFFEFDGKKKEVLFQEDVNGYLSVFVDGVEVIRSLKMGRLSLADYERVYKELLK
jgi:hypothetical protein